MRGPSARDCQVVSFDWPGVNAQTLLADGDLDQKIEKHD